MTRHDYSKLTPIEIAFLLDWFMYRVSMDDRWRLMNEHPTIYNKLVNQEVMVSLRKSEVISESSHVHYEGR